MQIDKNINFEHITDLLFKDNIIAFFQGASEAGPRALGNRSLLMSPINPKNKDTMNILKGRELFRPLAASVLNEKSKEWFEMIGIEESPYMSFSFKIKKNKKELVPAVVHVDDTCRVQTVTKEQNQNLYDLINLYYKKTNIPMLMNTSFNARNEPIVETIDDAIDCCKKIKVNYLYFPQAKILVSV
jgi:carbamoyltransferase|tara:strand:- start:217 stop:774 length:558 start_codon:yes stop_codon:yes gene_type:complete